MSRRFGFVAVLFFGISCLPLGLWACGNYGDRDRRPLAELVPALSSFAQSGEHAQRNTPEENGAQQAELVRALRQHGQAAVDALIGQRSRWAAGNGEANDPGRLKRLDDLIDRVAGQRHAINSRLFWHTSLESAQRDSQATGRPILSLRLLGRLDEDFSCANSRFFRTTLYPDPEISEQLRQQFVLHWSPVREVPQVTIDLGNGRKLQRPLTGNSVHLVLDPQGRPIDAMPGLVSATEFSKWLAGATKLWQQIENAEPKELVSVIANYHRLQAQQARERSTMAIQPGQAVTELDPTDRRWNDAAGEYRVRGLSIQAQTLIAQQVPAEVAMPLAVSKSFMETPLLRMVRQLDENITRDTAFNLLGLKPKIDDWFAEAAEDHALTYESLTHRIYAEVFLMPLTDPWLGLSPNDQFVALPNGGRLEPAASQSARLKQMLSGISFRRD